MVDNNDIPAEKLKDAAVVISDTTENPPSRDSARTPMQWNDSPQAGFSFGKEVEPWLPVHQNYSQVNVCAELADEGSILNFYRRLLRIRRNHEALQQGSWRSLIHYPLEHLAYLREIPGETILVVINFAFEQPLALDDPLPPEQWTVLLSTDYPEGTTSSLPETLQPFEVSIYCCRKGPGHP